ncbi:MAG: methyltransferase [Holosporaceae bacterium]|jgi:tRNA1(Val) A37 N6-methylase TrmN6|nr:methyltransferase [Holosporaceae bacterium]
MMELTEDSILNGAIKLLQPKNGYRVAIDPIILASFIKLEAHQRILDVGCGVGTIALILKKREYSAELTALDMDAEMCKICEQNSRINSLPLDIENVIVENHTILRKKPFDQIVTNPPFFQKESFRTSESKKWANVETIDLSNWIRCCFLALKNSGIFSMIHRASRLNEILSALGGIGSIQVVPIYPKSNREANRVIVQVVKSRKSEMKILPGIVAHRNNGDYTDTLLQMLSGSYYEFIK